MNSRHMRIRVILTLKFNSSKVEWKWGKTIIITSPGLSFHRDQVWRIGIQDRDQMTSIVRLLSYPWLGQFYFVSKRKSVNPPHDIFHFPPFPQNLQILPQISAKFIYLSLFSWNWRFFYLIDVFCLIDVFASPFFDRDAFLHHALHVHGRLWI